MFSMDGHELNSKINSSEMTANEFAWRIWQACEAAHRTPVAGIAEIMPGARAFTVCMFETGTVPPGTELFTAPTDIFDKWVVGRETVLKEDGRIPRIGITLVSSGYDDSAQLFNSFGEASTFIRNKGYPLGWVALELHRLIKSV